MNNIIKEKLRENRPNLSESSLTTYTSTIKNLYKNVFENEEFNLRNFEDNAKVLNFLKNVPSNKRKSILSALVVLTNDEAYRIVMNEDIGKYNEEIEKQEVTESQKENWVTSDEINALLEKYENESKFLYKKKEKTVSDLKTIQNYIILCLYSGKYIAPRRSRDYTDFKIKNINNTKDNYLDKNELKFNSFKTAKTYGTQQVKIPTKLKNILLKWISINPTEYLLFDSNLNQMTSVKLNQLLNKLFGGKKGKSVNALRHTYLTDKYGDMSKLSSELEKDMEALGSSVNVSKNYIKLNAPK